MTKREWMVVKVPYGGGYGSLNLAKPRGTKHAPDAFQKEFQRQSIFMADNGASVDQLEWLNAPIDLWRQNNYSGWRKMHQNLHNMAVCLFQDTKVLFLGGSHTITYSTVSALASCSASPVGLIVLDAHPDCCKKEIWPVHSDWLADLVRAGYLSPENVLILGIRQIEKDEMDFLKQRGIKYYTVNHLGDLRRAVTDNWSLVTELEKIANLEASYVSIDIDAVSGAHAPGTGCPSPGGLTDTEAVALVKDLKQKLHNLRAMDIVEIDPLNWWRNKILRHDATVDLGVKLIKEIVS